MVIDAKDRTLILKEVNFWVSEETEPADTKEISTHGFHFWKRNKKRR